MKIMLTNDDGYRADGINVLFKALTVAGHEVTIIAPELDSSGAGQSIAVYNPISLRYVSENIFYVTSTPADSVRLGLQEIYKDQVPDLVISGINLGENIAEDVLYSGTVGAAREAALHRIPALACSTPGPKFKHLGAAAQIIVNLVKKLEHNNQVLRETFLWNINIPNKPFAEIKGFETTELGHRMMHKNLVKQATPRGRIVFWQGEAGDYDRESSISTDTYVAHVGDMVSITPLEIMPTNYNQMATVSAIVI